MPDSLAHLWYGKFMETVQRHESAMELKEAAISGRLGKWTSALTRVVCSVCDGMGWKAAAKGHRSTLLPVAGQEYLALDVVETVLIVGSKDEASTFPYGFFKNWQFDVNLGRFARH